MNPLRSLFGLALVVCLTWAVGGCSPSEPDVGPEAPETVQPDATSGPTESTQSTATEPMPAETSETTTTESTPTESNSTETASTTGTPTEPATPQTASSDEQPEPASGPDRWPSWRGPSNNGVVNATGLVEALDPEGDEVIWRSTELATRSTPIILNGKLYTLARDEPGTKREGEKVICADPSTGEVLWENKFNVYLSDVPDTRVAWSCCVGDPETGNIYALGVCGYFACIDGKSGKTLWDRSLHEEFGLLSTYGGRTRSPIVHEDLVIIGAVIIGWGEMAKPADRFLGFNKRTGETVWFSGTTPLPDDTVYSSPMLAVLDGQQAMVFGAGDGRVWAFQPRTGVPIWEYELSARGLNTTPFVDDANDVVFIGQSEENPAGNTMGAMAAINGRLKGVITDSGTLWKNYQQMIGKSSVVAVGDRVYAADDSGVLLVLDAKTGETIDEQRLVGTIMRASLVHADGKIYACTTSGMCVLKTTEDGVEMLSRHRLPDGEEVHGSPIVWLGRVIIPSTEAMYCWSTSKEPGSATEPPPMEEEQPKGEDDKPAHLQVVPADAVMEPGKKLKFTARLFNERGQFLREAEAEFSVDNYGAFEQGEFTANADAEHVGAIVTAKAEGLEGMARVRIVPPLPWSFDFSSGEVPLSWIGARYRHVVREEEGEHVMVKVTTIPKGTRSQGWMGPTHLSNYTISADVLGREVGSKMPDIGLVAQRYTLDLMGAQQELQIRTWTPQLERFSSTVEFKWEPDVWYRMKFRAAVEDGKAVLRGKVWPRDEEEPSEWTVTAIDERPNVQGSPGLYGNAKDAEALYDNLQVVPNEQADKQPAEAAAADDKPAEPMPPAEPKEKPADEPAEEKKSDEPSAEKKAEPATEEKQGDAKADDAPAAEANAEAMKDKASGEPAQEKKAEPAADEAKPEESKDEAKAEAPAADETGDSKDE